jgi:hypothetical protein
MLGINSPEAMQSKPDSQKMIEHLISARIKVEDKQGHTREILVSEAMNMLRHGETKNYMPDAINEALDRFGMCYFSSLRGDTVMTKPNCPPPKSAFLAWGISRAMTGDVTKHMEKAQYGKSWANIMLTHPNVFQFGKDGKGRLRFAGGSQTYALILADDAIID